MSEAATADAFLKGDGLPDGSVSSRRRWSRKRMAMTGLVFVLLLTGAGSYGRYWWETG
ncbi:MAG: HlyD family secretion protein, partial [Actinomycetospora chiangmaiensis]|nr:HlyD family secretion protein [Actinomycetospora chiangmaiensis]